MATAREHRQLHEGLVQALGEEVGGTMIEVLAEMATKQDIVSLATRRDLEDLEARIGSRFDREAMRLTDELASVRGDISKVREDMSTQFGSLRHDIASLVLSRRTIVLTVVATVAGLTAAVAAAVAAVAALA